MFHSARIKLITWYIVIIMIVSLMFSVMIYQVLSREVERFERIQRIRIQRQLEGILTPPPLPNPELVEEVKRRILFTLFVINGGILIISGGLAYFLAGRTLRPIQDMVEEQNRFITDASHQLRTPLTSLKSALEVHLRDKNLTLKEAKLLMSQNIDDVNKLQTLSESLLQLAHYQQTNNHVTFKTIDIQSIIKESIQKVTPLANQKKITIKNKSTNYKMQGNQYELIDLFVIILDNAIKYSPENKAISIDSKRNDGSVTISIKDQGRGIEKKDLPHIFDRFYRAPTTQSQKNVFGYGLGLSIAKRIVDLHHGSITIKSTPGKGTVFQLTFRLQE